MRMIDTGWNTLLAKSESSLRASLPSFLLQRRWFGSKTRKITKASFQDILPIFMASGAQAELGILRVEFSEGENEDYVLPLALTMESRDPAAIIVRLPGSGQGAVYDALTEPTFASALLEMIEGQQHVRGRGELRASKLPVFSHWRGSGPLQPSIGKAEQSNTSVLFDRRLILKVFRRIQKGTNPDLEIGRFLTQERSFAHTAPVVGYLEYFPENDPEPTTLAVLQAFVPNKGDAWKYTLEELERWAKIPSGADNRPAHHILDLSDNEIPAEPRASIGTYLDSAQLLGQRTAELHKALAGDTLEPLFRPEPLSLAYQEALIESMAASLSQTLRQLGEQMTKLPDGARELARTVVERGDSIRRRLQPMKQRQLGGARCRCHGDYHLGQVLYTDTDFVIIDFEGEPGRPVRERREKHSPLRDVAGMLRSFHYAAHGVKLPSTARDFWYSWVSAAFLRAYRKTAATANFLPKSRDDLKLLLHFHLLEKAVYELGYEMNNRPDWVAIPLQGILQLATEG